MLNYVLDYVAASNSVIFAINLFNHFRAFRAQWDGRKNVISRRGPIVYMPQAKPLRLSLPCGLGSLDVIVNIGRHIAPVHVLATFGPPAAWFFIGTLRGTLNVLNWLSGTGSDAGLSRGAGMVWSLPELRFEEDAEGLKGALAKACIRLAASELLWVAFSLGLRVVNELDYQMHFIGIRERPKVITTGPYSIVRHPMYGVILAQTLLYSLVFWSYIPLWCTVINALAFRVKIPIEESLLEQNEKTGTDYREYKKRVKHKIVPCVW